jgi:hypothetical protein
MLKSFKTIYINHPNFVDWFTLTWFLHLLAPRFTCFVADPWHNLLSDETVFILFPFFIEFQRGVFYFTASYFLKHKKLLP